MHSLFSVDKYDRITRKGGRKATKATAVHLEIFGYPSGRAEE